MRFSVTIAVTVAAIAGSVIATPGPLYARALEQVNPFGRDEVDIYSRNNHHQTHHGSVVTRLELAINPTKSAIDLSQGAIDHGPPHEREKWTNQKKFHETMLHRLEKLRDAHRKAATEPGITIPLFHMVGETQRGADDVAEHAKEVCLKTEQAVDDYHKQHTESANDVLRAARGATGRALIRTQAVINRIARGRDLLKWSDRRAELQAMNSRLEKMHKAHKEDSLSSNSMDVIASAAVIRDQAKLLDLKAQFSLKSLNYRRRQKETPRRIL